MATCVNLNDFVWIELTATGLAELRFQDKDFKERFGTFRNQAQARLSEANANKGWTRWQLWDVMQTFGKVTGLGKIPAFSTTIHLTDPSKEPV